MIITFASRWCTWLAIPRTSSCRTTTTISWPNSATISPAPSQNSHSSSWTIKVRWAPLMMDTIKHIRLELNSGLGLLWSQIVSTLSRVHCRRNIVCLSRPPIEKDSLRCCSSLFALFRPRARSLEAAQSPELALPFLRGSQTGLIHVSSWLEIRGLDKCALLFRFPSTNMFALNFTLGLGFVALDWSSTNGSGVFSLPTMISGLHLEMQSVIVAQRMGLALKEKDKTVSEFWRRICGAALRKWRDSCKSSWARSKWLVWRRTSVSRTWRKTRRLWSRRVAPNKGRASFAKVCAWRVRKLRLTHVDARLKSNIIKISAFRLILCIGPGPGQTSMPLGYFFVLVVTLEKSQ